MSDEAHAALGFALNHLDDDGALSAFREALKYAGTESLSFVSHRDCLNNLGRHLFLKGQYEQAMTWFDQACWMSPDPKDRVDDMPDELQPPYKLAFENLLLCLAKLGNVAEAQKRVWEYCSHFSRVADSPRSNGTNYVPLCAMIWPTREDGERFPALRTKKEARSSHTARSRNGALLG